MILYPIQDGDTFEVLSEFGRPILKVRGTYIVSDRIRLAYRDSEDMIKVINKHGHLIQLFQDSDDLLGSMDSEGNLTRVPFGSKNKNKRNYIDEDTNLCIDVLEVYEDGYAPPERVYTSELNKLGFLDSPTYSEKSLKDVVEYVLIFVVTLFFLYLFVF